MIVTEVTGGGGGVVLGLYRGYLDLRSVLEIRPESVQCTVTCTPPTITDRHTSHWILSVGLYRGFIKSTVYSSCPILERSSGVVKKGIIEEESVALSDNLILSAPDDHRDRRVQIFPDEKRDVTDLLTDCPLI